MPCHATNAKKKQWICMFMNVNLPILVHKVLQRDNMFQKFHFYLITKATFTFFKLEFWEICTTLKALAKGNLLDLFLGVIVCIYKVLMQIYYLCVTHK